MIECSRLGARTLLRRVAPLLLAALALAVLAAPAQATIFGPRAGHSPNADDIRTAYWVAIAIAALLVVAVHVLLIAAIIRFRARRGRTPRRFVSWARRLDAAHASRWPSSRPACSCSGS